MGEQLHTQVGDSNESYSSSATALRSICMIITHFFNNHCAYFIATILTPTSLPDVYNMLLPPEIRLLVPT